VVDGFKDREREGMHVIRLFLGRAFLPDTKEGNPSAVLYTP